MVCGPFLGPFRNKYIMQRKMCPICRKNPVAINYYRGDRVYYRRACTPCIHAKREFPKTVPGWVRSGYKKREVCDRCNFRFRLVEQSSVYHVDGDINNNHWANLRTICANCRPEVAGSKWRPSPLQQVV